MDKKTLDRGKELQEKIDLWKRDISVIQKFTSLNPDEIRLDITNPNGGLRGFHIPAKYFDAKKIIGELLKKMHKELVSFEREFSNL